MKADSIRISLLVLIGMTATWSSSQVTPSTPPASGSPKPTEEVLELSPFVVSENDHVGYSANSTLAGTRLNTARRDVGASIITIPAETRWYQNNTFSFYKNFRNLSHVFNRGHPHSRLFVSSLK